MPTAPLYVRTTDREAFVPGGAYPTVSKTGVYVTDQATMNAIFAAAASANVILTTSTTEPPGYVDGSTVLHPFPIFLEEPPSDGDTVVWSNALQTWVPTDASALGDVVNLGVINIAPTGVAATDDTALSAAITAASAAGATATKIVVGTGNLAISSWHVIPDKVDIVGQGGGSNTAAARTTFTCTTAGAGIEIASGGSFSGFFKIDGALVSTTPFKRSGGLHANGRKIVNLVVLNNAISGTHSNDLALFYGAQNDSYDLCWFHGGDRDVAVFDNGFGGSKFYNCHFVNAGRFHMRFDNQVTAGEVYPYPVDIAFFGGICEGNGGTSVVNIVYGERINFYDWSFFTLNALSGPTFDCAGTNIGVHNPQFQETGSTQVAGSIGLRVSGQGNVTVTGTALFFNYAYTYSCDGVLSNIFEKSHNVTNNVASGFLGTNSATQNQVFDLRSYASALLGASSTFVETVYNFGRTAILSVRQGDGTMKGYSGTGFIAAGGSWGPRNSGANFGVPLGSTQPVCIGYGSLANRPAAAAALAGAIYANTDTMTVDVCDGTNWRSAPDHTWTSPALGTGAQSANYDTVGYTQLASGMVVFRGGLNSPALNTTLFTLPVGMRPATKQKALNCFTFGASTQALGYLLIGTDGTVKLAAGSNNLVVLDGLSFMPS